MKTVAFSFLGSGAARYLGLGFVPDFAHVQNVHGSDLAEIRWNREMIVKTTAPEGILVREDTKRSTTALTAGQGIIRYYGGDLVSAAAVTHLIPTNMVAGNAGDMRDKGTLGLINAWTLQTSGSRTGKFNAGCDTDQVGVGSKIDIGGKEFAIVAITADGDEDDQVTLNEAAPTGEIERISYKYGMSNAPAGMVMPAGLYLAETAHCNASAELCMLVAGTWN